MSSLFAWKLADFIYFAINRPCAGASKAKKRSSSSSSPDSILTHFGRYEAIEPYMDGTDRTYSAASEMRADGCALAY
jgi:hypothetical protein